MSRRRQSYRPYVGPTTDELHDTLYGTRERRASHLTLVHSVPAEQPDDVIYEPLWWGALLAAALCGVLLCPTVYGLVWLAFALFGGLL